MLTLAKTWYEDGSFWQFTITSIVALAVGALGAFATIRASNPRRRLSYSTLVNASLFVASHSQAGALTVRHLGTPVSRPRVVELELRNSGRLAITAAQFHDGQPLQVALGGTVVGVLDIKTSPSSTVAPSVDIHPEAPQKISIPPFLLARKQAVRMTLLIDGPKADVKVQAPLIDVVVREDVAVDQMTVALATQRLVVGMAAGGAVLPVMYLLFR
ncbi:hypothetical protein [Streptomyces sp. BBFR102]|uniref:hypothetical protein n=1 Tax=Streptomyces sp. BBFR102 TaxID=3448171 RepID=UPI003F53279B